MQFVPQQMLSSLFEEFPSFESLLQTPEQQEYWSKVQDEIPGWGSKFFEHATTLTPIKDTGMLNVSFLRDMNAFIKKGPFTDKQKSLFDTFVSDIDDSHEEFTKNAMAVGCEDDIKKLISDINATRIALDAVKEIKKKRLKQIKRKTRAKINSALAKNPTLGQNVLFNDALLVLLGNSDSTVSGKARSTLQKMGRTLIVLEEFNENLDVTKGIMCSQILNAIDSGNMQGLVSNLTEKKEEEFAPAGSQIGNQAPDVSVDEIQLDAALRILSFAYELLGHPPIYTDVLNALSHMGRTVMASIEDPNEMLLDIVSRMDPNLERKLAKLLNVSLETQIGFPFGALTGGLMFVIIGLSFGYMTGSLYCTLVGILSGLSIISKVLFGVSPLTSFYVLSWVGIGLITFDLSESVPLIGGEPLDDYLIPLTRAVVAQELALDTVYSMLYTLWGLAYTGVFNSDASDPIDEDLGDDQANSSRSGYGALLARISELPFGSVFLLMTSISSNVYSKGADSVDMFMQQRGAIGSVVSFVSGLTFDGLLGLGSFSIPMLVVFVLASHVYMRSRTLNRVVAAASDGYSKYRTALLCGALVFLSSGVWTNPQLDLGESIISSSTEDEAIATVFERKNLGNAAEFGSYVRRFIGGIKYLNTMAGRDFQTYSIFSPQNFSGFSFAPSILATITEVTGVSERLMSSTEPDRFYSALDEVFDFLGPGTLPIRDLGSGAYAYYNDLANLIGDALYPDFEPTPDRANTFGEEFDQSAFGGEPESVLSRLVEWAQWSFSSLLPVQRMYNGVDEDIGSNVFGLQTTTGYTSARPPMPRVLYHPLDLTQYSSHKVHECNKL